MKPKPTQAYVVLVTDTTRRSGLMVWHLLCRYLLVSGGGQVIWVQFPAEPLFFFPLELQDTEYQTSFM